MALTSDEINKLKEQLKDINQLSNQLGAGIDVKKFADVEKYAKEIKLMFDALSKRLVEAGEDTDYLVSNFQELVSSIQKSSSGVQQTNKALKTLSSIALSINEHQRGYNDLTSKDVKKLEEKLGKQKNILHISQLLLKAELDNLNAKVSLTRNEEKDRDRIVKSLKTGNDLLKNWNEDFKILQESLSKTKEEVEEIEKHLGLSGALTSSLSDSLSKLGMGGLSRQLGIDEAKSKMDNLAKSIVKNKNREKQLDEEIAAKRGLLSDKQIKAGFGGSELKAKLLEKESIGPSPASPQLAVMKAGISSMGASLKKNLLDPLTIAVGIIKLMVDGFFALDKAQNDFARETGHTVDHFDTINASLISSADYIKMAGELTKQMGMDATTIFSKGTLTEATELVELMGLGADEAGRLAILSKVNGKELDKVNKAVFAQIANFNKVNKTTISGKAILQDIAKISDTMALNFGFDAVKMAEAAANAKKFGLELSQVDKIADSLLDFESSITNELSAELITGKQFNLEKARLLALNNDINGLTKEIGQNQSIQQAFSSGNRLQQEQVAKMLGMQRDEVAKMIIAEKQRQGLSDEAIAKAAGMKEEDYKRLNLQESINKSISKMGEALAGPLAALAQMVEWLAKTKILWLFIGGVAIIKTINGIAQLAQSMKILKGLEIGSAIAKGWSAAMSSPASLITGGVAGLALGAIITAAIMSSVNGASKMKNGGQIPPGYENDTYPALLSSGETVLTKPMTTALNNKNSYTQPAKQSAYMDPSLLLNEMRAMRQEQAKANSKSTIIENSVNGTKFGTAVAMNTYKTS